MSSIQENLKSWIPFRISTSFPEIVCEWLFAGEKRFTEPFFGDTISALRLQAANRRHYKVLSLADMMCEWSSAIEPVKPSAIIFHISRCGSTLLSQLLCPDPKNIVLSEAPLLDEILRLPFSSNSFYPGKVQSYLQAALRFYGQKRFAEQEYLFLKTDSWHLHFYEAYRELFPDIPFILLYRSPEEVMLSQQRQRGLQSVPGLIEPELFGFSNTVRSMTDLDRYMAAVLETYFRKMLDIVTSDPLAFAFSYRNGLSNLVPKIYTLLLRKLEGHVAEQVAERCRYHGKRPQEIFTGDAGEPLLAPYLQPAVALYQELDSWVCSRR